MQLKFSCDDSVYYKVLAPLGWLQPNFSKVPETLYNIVY